MVTVPHNLMVLDLISPLNWPPLPPNLGQTHIICLLVICLLVIHYTDLYISKLYPKQNKVLGYILCGTEHHPSVWSSSRHTWKWPWPLLHIFFGASDFFGYKVDSKNLDMFTGFTPNSTGFMFLEEVSIRIWNDFLHNWLLKFQGGHSHTR